MKRLPAIVFGLCAAGYLIAPALAESKGGPALAAVCATCHRLDGVQAGAATITGRPADELVRTLQSFRGGVGDNHIMTTVCRALSVDEIVIVSRYLSTLGKEDAHR